ncbi:MAG: hypothetical protein IKP95_06765 [Ruminococcus sp.]|nr:hypothetical protein [Ruminococcus sp.]
MAFMLYKIDEAIDCKYIVTKTLNKQARAGSLIHVMDTTETSDGIIVDYRVTKTGQNFVIRFPTVKEFCKWCRPDSFLARHYDAFSKKEIMNYMKIKDRTVTSFCLPIIAVSLVIIWIAAIALIGGGGGIVVGIVCSLISVLGTLYMFKVTKEKMLVKLYGKVNTGISFK